MRCPCCGSWNRQLDDEPPLTFCLNPACGQDFSAILEHAPFPGEAIPATPRASRERSERANHNNTATLIDPHAEGVQTPEGEQ